MFLGQYTPAIEAAEELIATVPEAALRIESPPMADCLEAYLTMKQHVLVRFGKWREIIDQELPEDRELYCSNVAMMHYAKAVAHSALGNVEEAETEKEQFLAAKVRVPKGRRVHNNTVIDLLGVTSKCAWCSIGHKRPKAAARPCYRSRRRNEPKRSSVQGATSPPAMDGRSVPRDLERRFGSTAMNDNHPSDQVLRRLSAAAPSPASLPKTEPAISPLPPG